MKFKARYLTEHEVEFEASSLQQAGVVVDDVLHKARANHKIKLLGVIAEGAEWPDAEDAPSKPRPPRNTPPSGSPGTPRLPETTALLSVIAA